MTKSTPLFLPLRFPTGETIDLDPTLNVTVWGMESLCVRQIQQKFIHINFCKSLYFNVQFR